MGAAVSEADLKAAAERAEDEAFEPPMPEGFVLQDPFTDPTGAALAVAQAFGSPEGSREPDADAEVPVPADPTGDDSVSLPAGYVEKDGHVTHSARVRELNGEDEELLSRALTSENRARYVEVLLEQGVEMIGTHRIKDEPALLDDLVTGDRDALAIGIRRSTYGDDILATVDCECGTTSKIKIDVKEIEMRPLAWDAAEVWHEVPLRKGGFALVRLANGADQRECWSLPDTATLPEINSVLLSRCVQEVDGVAVKGSRAVVRKIGIEDRKTILKWMEDNQPGPQYLDMTHTCDVCKREVPLGLTAADLFRI
jgi:hypothetical protein